MIKIKKCVCVCHRVEDHDDIMHLFDMETTLLPTIDCPDFLVELITSQNERNHAAVCEVRPYRQPPPYHRAAQRHTLTDKRWQRENLLGLNPWDTQTGIRLLRQHLVDTS